jgi:NADH-quinone oxidoreductase subunit N
MLMLLSLAGIPVTAGFIGKFYAVAAGVSAQLWALVILLVLNSVIGVFYYLRVIVAMFDTPLSSAADPWGGAQVARNLTWTMRAPLGAVLILLLLLGLYPQVFISLVGIIFNEPAAGHTAQASF